MYSMYIKDTGKLNFAISSRSDILNKMVDLLFYKISHDLVAIVMHFLVYHAIKRQI